MHLAAGGESGEWEGGAKLIAPVKYRDPVGELGESVAGPCVRDRTLGDGGVYDVGPWDCVPETDARRAARRRRRRRGWRWRGCGWGFWAAGAAGARIEGGIPRRWAGLADLAIGHFETVALLGSDDIRISLEAFELALVQLHPPNVTVTAAWEGIRDAGATEDVFARGVGDQLPGVAVRLRALLRELPAEVLCGNRISGAGHYCWGTLCGPSGQQHAAQAFAAGAPSAVGLLTPLWPFPGQPEIVSRHGGGAVRQVRVAARHEE